MLDVDTEQIKADPFTSDYKYSEFLLPSRKDTSDDGYKEISSEDPGSMFHERTYNSESTEDSQNKRQQILKNKQLNKNKRNSISDQHKYKKVQVQAEETGVPRVQVNAGYDNPEIKCQGLETCAGVLLYWKLTFYGSD